MQGNALSGVSFSNIFTGGGGRALHPCFQVNSSKIRGKGRGG